MLSANETIACQHTSLKKDTIHIAEGHNVASVFAGTNLTIVSLKYVGFPAPEYLMKQDRHHDTTSVPTPHSCRPSSPRQRRQPCCST